jgi:hypothetical protein
VYAHYTFPEFKTALAVIPELGELYLADERHSEGFACPV